MRKINLEYEPHDADIILIADDLADRFDDILQEFSNWIRRSPDAQRFYTFQWTDGRMYPAVGTKEILRWINEFYPREEKAVILESGVTSNPDYPTFDY